MIHVGTILAIYNATGSNSARPKKKEADMTRPLTENEAARIARVAKANPGGFTIRLDGHDVPAAGFVVGITNNKAGVSGLSSAPFPAHYQPQTVGGWTAPAGTVFVDYGIIVDSLSLALAIAQDCQQQEIFSLARFECIKVD